MTVRSAPVIAVAIAVGAVAWIAAGQDPVYRVDKHVVPIYSTVVDSTGRLVPDLRREDFEVLDNGERLPVTLFDNDVQPITIVMMLDRSGSMTRNFDLERNAANKFLDELLPADKARLGNFSNRIQIDPPAFTSDVVELRRILQTDLQAPGPTPLWNATSAAMNALFSQTGRKVVLLFTDGEDNPYYEGVRTSLEQVRSRAIAEDVMVYAIGLAEKCSDGAPSPISLQRGPQGRGLPPPPPPIIIRVPRLPGGPGGLPPDGRRPPPDPGGLGPFKKKDADQTCAARKPDPGLRTLADEAGGAYIELNPADDLGRAFSRVAEELHRQYLLGFTPLTLDGRIHTIEVRVHRPGLTARARRSYVAMAER